MPQKIDNTRDTLDSREIEARIDELEGDREIAEDPEDPSPDYFTAAEAAELSLLLKLRADVQENTDEWRSGVTLTRDNWFTGYIREYAQETAADEVRPLLTGADDTWPFNHIDWDAAAEDMKSEFAEVDFAGVAYWVRTG